MFKRKMFYSSIMLLLLIFLASCIHNGIVEEPEPTADPRVFTDQLDRVEAREDQHVTFTTLDDGYDVFAPLKGSWGYRYGPSIIYYPDGSLDAWFATPGTGGEADWFTYKHSDDGGKTWSKEVVVLRPTPDSMDFFSVCDPGVVYFNGYYYIGYTSTIVVTGGGINNNVFVARSPNPDGPFEKWNGEGWGGDPQPIVYFDEDDSAWGAGEMSFVHLDDTLYCYYTWMCPDGDFEMVSLADASDENWPATMEYKGIAYKKASGQDSCDVFYLEDCGKFIALSTIERFTTTSGIAIMESDDGITFKRNEIIRTGISKFCHNMGVSKRPDGHVQLADKMFIGYAYSDGGQENWGKWATRFQAIELSVYDGDVQQTDRKGQNVLRGDYFWDPPSAEEIWPISIGTSPHTVEVTVDKGTRDLSVFWYDTNLKPHAIEDLSKLTFSDYDEDIISIKGKTMTLKAAGKTEVTMHYEGLERTFKVYVWPEGFKIGMTTPAIEVFRPVQEEMTVYMKSYGVRHKPQIRGYVIFEDGTWGEAYNDSTKAHPTYPALVPKENYEMVFEAADDSIIKVSPKGIITPRKEGTTSVKVTITGGKSFEVKVTVVAERP